MVRLNTINNSHVVRWYVDILKCFRRRDLTLLLLIVDTEHSLVIPAGIEPGYNIHIVRMIHLGLMMIPSVSIKKSSS